MKKTIFAIMSLVLLVLAACTDVQYPDAITSPVPTDLKCTNDGRQLTLTWSMPAGATGAIIYKDNVKLAEVEGNVNTYTIKRAEVNADNLYTVKAKYDNSLVSEGVSTEVHINYDVVTKAGFLLLADDYTKLADDDELAAAQWFNDNYVAKGTGAFVKPADVASIDVDEFPCLMITIDREGFTMTGRTCPKRLWTLWVN